MAITTYAELLTAVENWITRSDLDDRIPEFIALAEAEANRTLDCRQMYSRSAAFSINAASVALPTGFAGVRAFHLNTDPVTPLTYVKADEFDDPWKAADSGAGRPAFYTIVGSNFLFSPSPDTTYTATLVYRTTLTALSASNTSNWLLASHPDAYLWGALANAYQYLEDDAEEQKFRALFGGVLAQVNAADNRHAYGQAPSRRMRGFV